MSRNESSQADADDSDDLSSSDWSREPNCSLEFAPFFGGLTIFFAIFILLKKGYINLTHFSFIMQAIFFVITFAVYYKENRDYIKENPFNSNDKIVSQINSNANSESFSSSSSKSSKKRVNQDMKNKKNSPKKELKNKPPLKETLTELKESINHKKNSSKSNNKNSSEIMNQDNKKSSESIKKGKPKPNPKRFLKKLPEDKILINFIFENSSEFDTIQKTLNLSTVIGDIKQDIINEYKIKSDILIKYQKKDGTQNPIDLSKTIHDELSKILGKHINSLYIEIILPPQEMDNSYDEIDFDVVEPKKNSIIPTKRKTISDVFEEDPIDEFIKCDEQFIEKNPQTKYLKPKTEALFTFSTKFKSSIDDYKLPIYDDSITIGEIKVLISSLIPKSYGPKRICLKYNDIEIKDDNSTFKKLKNKNYLIQKGEKTVIIETRYYEDLTVKYLEKEIKMKEGEQLKLRNKVLKSSEKLDDLHISDDDIIQLEKINETKEKQKQITFVIYENNNKSRNIKLDFKKNIADYQEELDIDINEYAFVSSQGKILKDTINLDDYRIVYAFPINNEADDNYLYESAKCVFRMEKPQIKIKKIEVRNADEYDDPSEKIMIDYDKVKGPNTIGDLTLKVANELGFTKSEDIEKVSLFILFNEKDGCNFALLGDNDDIASILNNNPGMFISYKIIKEKKNPRKNLLNKLKEQAREKKLDLSDDDIINIHAKTYGNIDCIISTFAYIASK